MQFNSKFLKKNLIIIFLPNFHGIWAHYGAWFDLKKIKNILLWSAWSSTDQAEIVLEKVEEDGELGRWHILGGVKVGQQRGPDPGDVAVLLVQKVADHVDDGQRVHGAAHGAQTALGMHSQKVRIRLNTGERDRWNTQKMKGFTVTSMKNEMLNKLEKIIENFSIF